MNKFFYVLKEMEDKKAPPSVHDEDGLHKADIDEMNSKYLETVMIFFCMRTS